MSTGQTVAAAVEMVSAVVWLVLIVPVLRRSVRATCGGQPAASGPVAVGLLVTTALCAVCGVASVAGWLS